MKNEPDTHLDVKVGAKFVNKAHHSVNTRQGKLFWLPKRLQKATWKLQGNLKPPSGAAAERARPVGRGVGSGNPSLSIRNL